MKDLREIRMFSPPLSLSVGCDIIVMGHSHTWVHTESQYTLTHSLMFINVHRDRSVILNNFDEDEGDNGSHVL